jgi:hypothetical protein
MLLSLTEIEHLGSILKPFGPDDDRLAEMLEGRA